MMEFRKLKNVSRKKLSCIIIVSNCNKIFHQRNADYPIQRTGNAPKNNRTCSNKTVGVNLFQGQWDNNRMNCATHVLNNVLKRLLGTTLKCIKAYRIQSNPSNSIKSIRDVYFTVPHSLPSLYSTGNCESICFEWNNFKC